MKKIFLLLFIYLISLTNVQAQLLTDVTEFFLTNGSFDSDFNYDKNTTGNISGDVIHDVFGWEKESSANFTVAGTFAYGSGATFNGSSAIPAAGYNNSEGGALALSTGWAVSLKYFQPIRLVKGEYMIVSAYHNLGTATAGSSLTGWVPNENGQSTFSTVNSFLPKTWIADTIRFTLSETTEGVIQTGFKAIEGVGSGSNAKILIDYIKILYLGVDKTELNAKISEADAVYNESGIDANILLNAMTKAKNIADKGDADMLEVLEATKELDEILLDYQLTNATSGNPLDFTHYIVNPSFEDNFTGWDNIGMVIQTNTLFPFKNENNYIEKWVNRGSKIPNVSISQLLTGIPNGKYRLTAAAGNIQQTGSGSSENNSTTPQTGVVLFAGFYSTEVNTVKDYSMEFVVVDNQINIGLKAENATGNWVTSDNFRLKYIGKNTATDYAEYLKNYMSEAQKLLTERIQNSVKQNMQDAIAQAQQAVNEQPLTLDNLIEAKETLDAAIISVEASAQLYADLQDAIASAEKVLGWYKNDESKREKMQSGITTANESLNNFDLTDAEINKAVSDLQAITKSVDKKIHINGDLLGDVNNNNDGYSYVRSKQSKNWILFWEKGYGDNPASFTCGSYTLNLDALLNVAENCFEFYADSLKFIKTESSKTDEYKMIIRLRYTTDWEASGSGVDDLIGLLTLTASSANDPGHTVAHEVGHCFQYQVHCDNNDQNGWMYGFGANASGANGWWEQCAQWQAFKIYPQYQFTDYRFSGYLNTVHKHILHEAPRYDNFFIQDYWAYRHGMDIIGRLWNESKRPEDPVETYKRITGITQSQFNDEMYDCAARFATWDITHLKSRGANYINSRPQPAMTETMDNAWLISSSACLENYGHNIIKLNTPKSAETISVYFEGKAGMDGYRKNYLDNAGWRYGFVALLKDGTRIYSNMGAASASEPESFLHFDCPDNCNQLWLVVSGAPSAHWHHAWDGDDSNDEQWPYQVRFNNTNLNGFENMSYTSNVFTMDKNNMQLYALGSTLYINEMPSDVVVRIYNMTGNCLLSVQSQESSFSTTLSTGIYVVNITSGKEVYTRKIVIE